MHAPLLSLRLEQHRPSVVLDLDLMLGPGPLGLALARSLSRTMELWQVAELWHVLDNTCHWRADPEVLLPGRPAAQVRDALDACERWRTETDVGRLGCYYLGDQDGESFLPDDANRNLLRLWQLLAQTFELHARDFPAGRPLAAAWRDAAALSAALVAAPILTLAPANGAPAIAEALDRWQVAALDRAPHDGLLAYERAILRGLCAAAGAAKLVWAGLGLAVLHLVVPGAACLAMPAGDEFELAPRRLQPSGENPWSGARAFWYRL
jgi:hypothetical protein